MGISESYHVTMIQTSYMQWLVILFTGKTDAVHENAKAVVSCFMYPPTYHHGFFEPNLS